MAAANSFDHGNISRRVGTVLQVIGERTLNLYFAVDRQDLYIYISNNRSLDSFPRKRNVILYSNWMLVIVYITRIQPSVDATM